MNIKYLLLVGAFACACTSTSSPPQEPPPQTQSPVQTQNGPLPEGPEETQNHEDPLLNHQLSMTTHSIVPTCSDIGRSGAQPHDQGVSYDPPCFPSASYFFNNQREGYFFSMTNQPLPILEKSCGDFHILVVFFNSAQNRRLWAQNTTISSPLRNQLRDHPLDGLPNLFRDYSPQSIFESLGGTNTPMTFQFEFRVLDGFQDSQELAASEQIDEFIQQFLAYDAVLFLEDLGTIGGMGIGKWPMRHPLYNPQMPYAFRINPTWLTPGLFANEFFRRSVPVALSEYTYGTSNLVVDHGVTYDRTPIYNPRTSENIYDPLRATPLHVYLNGWSDIDGDGAIDCQDDTITATTDNIDADLIPDVFDPDITRDNGPYFWRSSSERR